jgi:hypothetical protein
VSKPLPVVVRRWMSIALAAMIIVGIVVALTR